jgi:putative addiction module CopG family antidote
MNVTLPTALEQWVQAQVRAGEFRDASDVIRAAVRLFRECREEHAQGEIRRAFAELDQHNAKGEPTTEDLAMIERAVRRVRKTNGQRK